MILENKFPHAIQEKSTLWFHEDGYAEPFQQ
jgi:hypothetical protein